MVLKYSFVLQLEKMRAEFGAESSEGEGEEKTGRNSSLSNKSTSSQQKEVKTKGKKSSAPKRKVRCYDGWLIIICTQNFILYFGFTFCQLTNLI
jgi:hypothetical protein